MVWDLQASAGAAGQSILWRGTWSSAASYNPYDAVYSGLSSYISKTNNANKNPESNPSDWDLLAAQGPEGPVGGLPVGTIIDYAGLTEPTGWLFCFGQSLPTTGIYADLFGVLAYAYGGSGGNFNLPDFRGRVGAGRDNMGGVAANRLTSAWSMDGTVLGANGGTESHLLTTPQMPSHQHTYRLFGGSGLTAWAAGTGTYQDNVGTGFAGGGLAHPNCQPTLVVNRIIKYSSTILGPITPGTGDVVGPGATTSGNLATYADATGKQLGSSSFYDAMPAGGVVQRIYVETATAGSGTALIPVDDTIPQYSEGTLFAQVSATITPRYANSQIIGRVAGMVATTIANTCTLSMFRGTGPSAIASMAFTTPNNNYQLPMNFVWQDFPGVTTAVTYNLRFGPNSAATVAFNGTPTGPARYYGGTSKTSHLVEEIKQ